MLSSIKEKNKTRTVAAIDLGSNSFHMILAKIEAPNIKIINRTKRRVQLASGLDKDGYLAEDAIERGLNCLSMFAEKLQGFKAHNVKIVATFTLRKAKNAQEFLVRAANILPFPIEIISGSEEARLIFLGIAHTQAYSGKKLVIDIGGGSTELIIGSEFTPLYLNSKHMGCVSFTQRFFSDDECCERNFYNAQLACEQKLENIAAKYKSSNWDIAIGSSGSIKAIREMIIANGHEDGIITLHRLDKIIELCFKCKKISKLNIPGLSAERAPVIMAGIAILRAILKSLAIDELLFSSAALREGVLYELDEKFRSGDIRIRTVKALTKSYALDIRHAQNVQITADHLARQALKSTFIQPKTQELCSMLNWAASLHEIGLNINYKAFHKHSAYIMEHINLPGFSHEQQRVIAILARFQRKSLKLKEMPELIIYKAKHIYPLIKLLRLAIVLNAQRQEKAVTNVELEIVENKHQCEWNLIFNDKFLQENRLLRADLENEKIYWNQVGWVLNFSSLD